jgi:hypothetical protein
MARRSKRPELEIRASFEAARIAPQCLTEAYERTVPIPRRPTRTTVRLKALPAPAAAAERPGWRRVERG